MSPLPGNLHGHPPVFANVSQTRLGLQVGVLLGRGAIFALDDHVRRGKSRFHIPFADAVMAKDIRFILRVQPRRFGFHRFLHVRHHRQVFILDLDQVARLSGNLFCFSDHQRHLIADEAHPVGERLARARSAQAPAGRA